MFGNEKLRAFTILIFSSILLLAQEMYPQAVKIKGEDFRANSVVSGFQASPDIVFQGDSYDFVIAWYDDTSPKSVLFRLFDQFLVPRNIPGHGDADRRVNRPEDSIARLNGGVAIDSYNDGEFIVSWSGKRGSATEDSIFIQRFNYDGTFDFMGSVPSNGNQAIWMDLLTGPGYDLTNQEHVHLSLFEDLGYWYGFIGWTQTYNRDPDSEYGTIFRATKPYLLTGHLFIPLGHIDPSPIADDYLDPLYLDLGGDTDVGPNGIFVDSWDFDPPEGEEEQIRMKRFHTDGTQEGLMIEYDYAPWSTSAVSRTAVTVDNQNRILVAWAEDTNIAPEGQPPEIVPVLYARRYLDTGAFDVEFSNIQDNIGVIFTRLDVASMHVEGAEPSNDDYYIFVWLAPAFSGNAVYARILDESGNDVEGYEGVFRVSDGLVHNTIGPRVAVYKDRFLVAFTHLDGDNRDVYVSPWSVDGEEPLVSGTWDHDGFIKDVVPNVMIYTHAQDGTGSLYPSGLDAVKLMVTFDYSPYLEECDFQETLTMEDAGGDFYRTWILQEKLLAGTTVRYYAEVNDNALNITRDPANYQERPLVFYVANRGDLNVNGLLDPGDVGRLCSYLAGEINLEPHEMIFADYDADSDIDCDDYRDLKDDALDDLPPFPSFPCDNQQAVEVGDFLEMGVGSGDKGQVKTLALYLDNDSTEVRDVYYYLDYDTTVIKLTGKALTPRTQGFTVLENCCDEFARIGLAGGAGSISCAHGSIMDLTFTVKADAPNGSSHITLTEGALADTLSDPFLHHHLRGKFFVPSAPPVSIVCTPMNDTSLVRGDTLRFNTTLTNHHWQGVTASVFMYGTVTPEGMNPFLVVDTTHVFIPQGARVKSMTEIEVPQYAPLVHYEFTGYVCENSNVYDTDTFGFSVTDTLGMIAGEPALASAGEGWKLLSGWFGEGTPGKEEMSSSKGLPKSFALSQNYPNPFNPVTEIVYSIPEKEAVGVPVKLVIYDMRGRLIKKFEEGVKLPGRYSIVWDGKDSRGRQAGSGIYFYLLMAGEDKATRKMLLIK